MIKVFQINLTNEEIDIINSDPRGFEAFPKASAYRNRSFISTFDPASFEFYDHVATVDADDLEVAFELMNLWNDRSRVTMHTDGVSSMSVGDIIELDGIRYRCASFGFERIEE